MSEERRRRARIAVEIPCTLVGPSATGGGHIYDFSSIGAKVITGHRVASDDDPVELRADGLTVNGRVMYARERDGKIVSGIQFLDLDAERYRAVVTFIEGALEGDGGGKRADPRVQHRVEVVCETSKRAKAMLHDISRGGMRVFIEDTVTVGDELTAEITIGTLSEPLLLTGSVVRVKSVDAGNKQLVGVKLGEVPEESQGLLDRLLAHLLEDP
ncbi:MAG: PilZ domain-containing protein [Deltaproteobacteria bacterium]|nr:PilZ domain-containing protein [Deltaproteobacteria bacterium]